MASTDTLDLLSLTSKDALEQFLASIALPDVPVDQLQISDISSEGGTLTKITVQLLLDPAGLSTWEYGGQAVLEYNRIDLADMFEGITMQFQPDSYPTTTAWLCQQIATIGQIVFDPADFIQETITQEMALQYYLKAAPGSLRYVGEVPVVLYALRPLVSFFIPPGHTVPVTNMGDMLSLTSDLGIGVSSIDTNGTYYASMLKNFVTGRTFTVSGDPIAWDLFNWVLDQPFGTWTIDKSGAKPFNGYGAVVTYNGPIDPNVDKPYNVNLTQVCRIQLNPSYCLNQSGTLSIYYTLTSLETPVWPSP